MRIQHIIYHYCAYVCQYTYVLGPANFLGSILLWLHVCILHRSCSWGVHIKYVWTFFYLYLPPEEIYKVYKRNTLIVIHVILLSPFILIIFIFQLVHSPTLEKSWRDQWRKAAKKALSLPDAAQVRMKFGVSQVQVWVIITHVCISHGG